MHDATTDPVGPVWGRRARGCGARRLRLFVGFGHQPTSSPAVSTSVSQGCAELATLKDSLTALTQVEPVQDGLNALESAVATVKTDLQSAATAVSDELKPTVDEVQSSFDQLENALQGVTDDTLAASATEIGTALTAMGTSLTDLEAQLSEKCP